MGVKIYATMEPAIKRRQMIDGVELCQCGCHQDGSKKHRNPCCWPCGKCDKRVNVLCLFAHEMRCFGKQLSFLTEFPQSIPQCRCSCHKDPGSIRHMYGCCDQCPFCKKRFAGLNMRCHRQNCPRPVKSSRSN